MLKAEDKISDVVIENMMSWRHSGFNVYCSPIIWPDNTNTRVVLNLTEISRGTNTVGSSFLQKVLGPLH